MFLASLLPLLLGFALLAQAVFARRQPLPLRFADDGTFKLAVFTDLHYGSNQWRDARTSKIQQKLLEIEKPQLVLLSGDVVTGFMNVRGKEGWFEKQYTEALAPIWKSGIPYAYALGNHDVEAELSGRQILGLDMRSSELSLTQQGPEGMPGASNYWVDILGKQGEKAAARVWVLDSGREGCEDEREGWGCIPSATLSWVARTAAALPAVPTQLAVFHIPPRQMMELWNEGATVGRKGESVSCPLKETGAFQVLRDAGIQAMIFGHDHKSDFSGVLDGVMLAYGRKTGVGNYGLAGFQHGARLLLLREGQSAAGAETWIRNEAGGREDQSGALQPAEKRLQKTCGRPGAL